MALSIVGSLGCGRSASGPRVFAKAPVVLVSIDTLRADRLPDYGYAAGRTPALSALARESILFENATAHAPLTLPSHASVFTGLLPADHGVRDNLGYSLRPDVKTLAQLLRGAGYETGGAVSAAVLSASTGIARGFDFWDDALEPSGAQTLGRVHRPGLEAEAALGRFLDRPREVPPFAFLHVFEPHAPYEPPEPFRSSLRDPYDGEVAAADAVVGRLVTRLEEAGLYERAVIVVFADHGEGLGDHGEDEHGVFLYRETTHVPLLVRLPGARHAGTRVAAEAGLADIFPTVLSLVGVDAPERGPRAVSLLTLLDPESPPRKIYSETLYPRIHLGWSDLASLTTRRFQYVGAPRPELYDLASDPRQARNLAGERSPELRAFTAEMERVRGSFVAPAAAGREEAARLASLGYLTARAPELEGLPDPKDRIASLPRVKEAFGHVLARRDAEAESSLRALLTELPDLADAREGLAVVLCRNGRAAEALDVLREGLERPGARGGSALLSAARIALDLGRPEEARRYAARAYASGDPAAGEVFSRAELALHNTADATRLAREAVAAGGARRSPRLTLARALVARGEHEEALKVLDEVERLTLEGALGPVLSHRQLRGEALARLGRGPEAEMAFLEEIRLFPTNVDAWVSLANLYASAGQPAQARRVLDRLARSVPGPAARKAVERAHALLGT